MPDGTTDATEHDGERVLQIDINGKRFVTTGNEHGVSGAETIFEYATDGDRITGRYRGGRIADGHLVGKVAGADRIELLFQCLTTDGELMAGASRGRVSRNARGLVELQFEWAWLTGDRSGGHSSYVEVMSDA
jgi:hypothetical protein